MMKKSDIQTHSNMGAAWMYFVVHFLVEVVCFYLLSSINGNLMFLGLAAIIYDAMAFVPQGIIGAMHDANPKFKPGPIGYMLLISGFLMYFLGVAANADNNIPLFWLALILLCLGNCGLHISGAELTLRVSNGKMSHSAIFVGGGSFGLVTGKLLAQYGINFWWVALASVLILPLVLLAENYKKTSSKDSINCKNFNYARKDVSVAFIIAAAFIIVAVRAYMGYGIPTAWRKTVIQTILLYVFMGTGKCLGGVLIDKLGIYKTAIISIAGSVPFLLFGNNIMEISLIGIMFFSMTMAITLAVLVSVIKECPGGAFGITTIGLFLGTFPTFVFRVDGFAVNCVIILIASVICLILALKILPKEGK